MKWFQHRNVDTEGLGSPPGCSTTCVMIGHHTVIWQRDRGDATESSRTFQGIRVPIPRNMKTKFPKSFLVSTARVVGAGRGMSPPPRTPRMASFRNRNAGGGVEGGCGFSDPPTPRATSEETNACVPLDPRRSNPPPTRSNLEKFVQRRNIFVVVGCQR